MTTQIDTSGTVDAAPGQHIKVGDQLFLGIGWAMLNPFTQGFIEAALMAAQEKVWPGSKHEGRALDIRFSDLAPETLAWLMEDCEAMCSPASTERSGRRFWMNRRAGELITFPPIRLYLADDGKVRIGDAS